MALLLTPPSVSRPWALASPLAPSKPRHRPVRARRHVIGAVGPQAQEAARDDGLLRRLDLRAQGLRERARWHVAMNMIGKKHRDQPGLRILAGFAGWGGNRRARRKRARAKIGRRLGRREPRRANSGKKRPRKCIRTWEVSCRPNPLIHQMRASLRDTTPRVRITST